MTPLCPKGHRAQQEAVGDWGGISMDLHCPTCGWRQFLTPGGQPYLPPAQLDPEDLALRGSEDGAGRRGHNRTEHKSRMNRDGCRAHDHCLTCPFAECLIAQPWLQDQIIAARRREMWFGGKPVADLVDASVHELAAQEGVGERTIFRRLAVLRETKTPRC